MAPIAIDTKECGTKKNCFISPNDCDIKNEKCMYVLKWDFDGHYINYELTAVVKGWISVLFSEDKKLVRFHILSFFNFLDKYYYQKKGNDNIVTCKHDEQPYSNNVLISHHHVELKGSEVELKKLPISKISEGDGLSKTGGYYKDGVINCKFSRTKTSSVELVNNLNKAHFIHVSTGVSGISIF